MDLACQIALDATEIVTIDEGGGRKEIDIKRYAKVEKVITFLLQRVYVKTIWNGSCKVNSNF